MDDIPLALDGVNGDLKTQSKAAGGGRQRQDAMTKLGLPRARSWWKPRTRAPQLMVALGAAVLASCAHTTEQKLTAPAVTVSPYDASRGEVLWAVVPLRNE